MSIDNISIIAKDNCELSVDVEGEYGVCLTQIQGMYNTTLLDEDDFIEWEGGGRYPPNGKPCDFYSDASIDASSFYQYLLNKEPNLANIIDFDDTNYRYKYKFKKTITNCSNRFKYLLGLRNFPKTVPANAQVKDYVDTDRMPMFNGSPYIFIICQGLNSTARYVWQKETNLQDKERDLAMYASTKNIVSVNANQFTLTMPFQLNGGEFRCNGNELHNVKFKMVGMYGEAIPIYNEVLWSFQLVKVDPPKPPIGCQIRYVDISDDDDDDDNYPKPSDEPRGSHKPPGNWPRGPGPGHKPDDDDSDDDDDGGNLKAFRKLAKQDQLKEERDNVTRLLVQDAYYKNEIEKQAKEQEEELQNLNDEYKDKIQKMNEIYSEIIEQNLQRFNEEKDRVRIETEEKNQALDKLAANLKEKIRLETQLSQLQEEFSKNSENNQNTISEQNQQIAQLTADIQQREATIRQIHDANVKLEEAMKNYKLLIEALSTQQKDTAELQQKYDKLQAQYNENINQTNILNEEKEKMAIEMQNLQNKFTELEAKHDERGILMQQLIDVDRNIQEQMKQNQEIINQQKTLIIQKEALIRQREEDISNLNKTLEIKERNIKDLGEGLQRNTTEFQSQILAQKEQISQQKEELDHQKMELNNQMENLAKREKEIEDQKSLISEMRHNQTQLNERIEKMKKENEENMAIQNAQLQRTIVELENKLQNEKANAISSVIEDYKKKEKILRNHFESKINDLQNQISDLQEANKDLENGIEDLDNSYNSNIEKYRKQNAKENTNDNDNNVDEILKEISDENPPNLLSNASTDVIETPPNPNDAEKKDVRTATSPISSHFPYKDEIPDSPQSPDKNSSVMSISELDDEPKEDVKNEPKEDVEKQVQDWINNNGKQYNRPYYNEKVETGYALKKSLDTIIKKEEEIGDKLSVETGYALKKSLDTIIKKEEEIGDKLSERKIEFAKKAIDIINRQKEMTKRDKSSFWDLINKLRGKEVENSVLRLAKSLTEYLPDSPGAEKVINEVSKLQSEPWYSNASESDIVKHSLGKELIPIYAKTGAAFDSLSDADMASTKEIIRLANNARDSPTQLTNLLSLAVKSGWDPNRILNSIRFTNEERDKMNKNLDIPHEAKLKYFENYDANNTSPVKELVNEINKNPYVKKRLDEMVNTIDLTPKDKLRPSYKMRSDWDSSIKDLPKTPNPSPVKLPEIPNKLYKTDPVQKIEYINNTTKVNTKQKQKPIVEQNVPQVGKLATQVPTGDTTKLKHQDVEVETKIENIDGKPKITIKPLIIEQDRKPDLEQKEPQVAKLVTQVPTGDTTTKIDFSNSFIHQNMKKQDRKPDVEQKEPQVAKLVTQVPTGDTTKQKLKERAKLIYQKRYADKPLTEEEKKAIQKRRELIFEHDKNNPPPQTVKPVQKISIPQTTAQTPPQTTAQTPPQTQPQPSQPAEPSKGGFYIKYIPLIK